jgi:hypothetical protein
MSNSEDPTVGSHSGVDELARRLAIAYVSYFTNVSYPTTLKNYGTQPVGPYWIAVAERVCADMAASNGNRFADLFALRLVPTNPEPLPIEKD